MITLCEGREFSVEFTSSKADEIIARQVTKYLKDFIFLDFIFLDFYETYFT